MGGHINDRTGNWWIDEEIQRRARKQGLIKTENDGDYNLFDRAGYINACLDKDRPIVIIWVPSSMRLHCRWHSDIYGISDMVNIEEILTLFTNIKGMERFRIFLIPYLLTGYDIPEELERDVEPLVPFTAKTIEMMKGIEEGR